LSYRKKNQTGNIKHINKVFGGPFIMVSTLVIRLTFLTEGFIWLTEYKLRDQNVTLISYETKM